ncbi:DUF5060 domain-containing protein [bacterium]|nr:DUF5060 domain-containing protein [bacterium]
MQTKSVFWQFDSKVVWLLSAIVFAVNPSPLLAAPNFAANFESGSLPQGFSNGGSVISSQGYSDHGFGSYLLWSVAANTPAPTLTLHNLPEHTSVQITFDLALIDSWDGTDPNWGPDYFNVQVAGNTEFSSTFSTWSVSSAPGTTLLMSQPAALGFNADFMDTAYRITITVPHSAASVVIAWFANGAGWTGGDFQWPDESWAIDNINVTLLGGPSITQDPTDQSVTAGDSAVFTASANATVPAPTVRWQQSINDGVDWNDLADGGGVSGSGTGTLTLANATIGMSGYRYRLKAVYQSRPVYSASALLTVSPVQEPEAVLLTAAHPWQKVEFRLDHLPTVSNPFDPDEISVDAMFMPPTGSAQSVPAFWYRPFTRGLSGGYETITAAGPGEWRLRYTPTQAGNFGLAITIRTNGQVWKAIDTKLQVDAVALPTRFGFVRNDASNRHFQTDDGKALRLIGANVAWPGARGTLDYDDWFPAMESAQENFARIWMSDWSLGIETELGTLLNYNLSRAWQLDYVMNLAEQHGIYLMLCLEIDGMFQSVVWPRHPYNAANGGPVPSNNPNGYFTQSDARTLFQKRLRYLIARYGYSQHLLAWEFFNEIDNSYYLLNPPDIFAWHGVMSQWLHDHDPFRHLITTSLKGGSDEPQLWNLPNLDFACYHSYGETSFARRYSAVAQDFMRRYQKPVLIAEFGVSGGGWRRQEEDPYARGFRQALWGGALGGSVGTAMSWWWENLHSENYYPYFDGLGKILNRTGWGSGNWTPIETHADNQKPVIVGDLIDGGQAFDSQLAFNTAWDGLVDGHFALPSPEAGAGSVDALNGFLHGYWHDPTYRLPFVVSAWFDNNAKVVIRVNTVAVGAILTVKVDGLEVYRTNLENRDYNQDFPVNLPAGKHTVELFNPGSDWISMDWVRFEKLLPSTYAGNWMPPAESIGLRGPHESLLYIVAPGQAFPGYATNAVVPVIQGQTVVLTNWPSGDYFAEWYHPSNGVFVSRVTATTANGALALALPDFVEDLAGIVYGPPRLTVSGVDGDGHLQMELHSETGGHYVIDRATLLPDWSPHLNVDNPEGTLPIVDPSSEPTGSYFYRARKP